MCLFTPLPPLLLEHQRLGRFWPNLSLKLKTLSNLRKTGETQLWWVMEEVSFDGTKTNLAKERKEEKKMRDVAGRTLILGCVWVQVCSRLHHMWDLDSPPHLIHDCRQNEKKVHQWRSFWHVTTANESLQRLEHFELDIKAADAAWPPVTAGAAHFHCYLSVSSFLCHLRNAKLFCNICSTLLSRTLHTHTHIYYIYAHSM